MHDSAADLRPSETLSPITARSLSPLTSLARLLQGQQAWGKHARQAKYLITAPPPPPRHPRPPPRPRPSQVSKPDPAHVSGGHLSAFVVFVLQGVTRQESVGQHETAGS